MSRPSLKAAKNMRHEIKNCNLEREIRRDKVGITRHVMMHQVLYIVQLPNEEGGMHIK